MNRLRSRQMAWLAATTTFFLALIWACLACIAPTAQAATWTATGSMGTARDGHTSTLLPNGNVLVAGGENSGVFLASAELYDPATGIFSATGSMGTTRYNHIAALLPNGKVLVAGGTDSSNSPLASAELYDPATGTFTATGSMRTTRHNPSASRLLNGEVLVAGGNNKDPFGFVVPLSSAESYDPATGTFFSRGPMGTPREWHMMTLLPSGKVLVSGGSNTGPLGGVVPLSSAELYDPVTGNFSPTGSMGTERYNPTATLLANGKVLVAGGFNLTAPGGILPSADLYDPATGTFSATGSMVYTLFNTTATLLPDGTVLFAGGENPTSFANTVSEMYDPGTGSFSFNVLMVTGRYNHYATESKSILLPNGQVLVAGGFAGGVSLASAELYDPGTSIPFTASFYPSAGPVGTMVTVSGANFGAAQGSSTVTFNGTIAGNIPVWNNGQIQVAVPAGANSGPIVITIAGTAGNAIPFTFTVTTGNPLIGSISPNSGMVGTPVTITGSNFGAVQGSSTVAFNGTIAGTVSGWSNGRIEVEVPAGASTGPITVNIGGTAGNAIPFTFTVTPPPVISSTSPGSGPVGSLVTITGSNFGLPQGTSTVTFNGTTAGSITSWSDTQIQVTVPVGATTGPVVVTVAGAPSNGVTFTVTPPPVINSISPLSGQVGSPVSIAGSNFGAVQGVSAVSFNGTIAAVTSWSDTLIQATVPVGATTGPIIVTVGAQSNGVTFTVQTPTPIVVQTGGGGGGGCSVAGTSSGLADGVGACGAYLLLAVGFAIRKWAKRRS